MYDELNRRDDDLTHWAENHRSMLLSLTVDLVSSIAAVNRWAKNSPDYDAGAKNAFASAADSFLVGYALAGGHTVVTHERISDSRKRIKTPNAAITNDVLFVDPFQMLRRQRACFVLLG